MRLLCVSISKNMSDKRIIMIRALSFFALAILMLSGLSDSHAQTPFLAATASKQSVATGEQFQITYSFNASGRSFQGPDLSEFQVLSGPNQSTSMQIINGNVSQSVSFSYYLAAKNPGTFKIGPASIEYEGKRIASNVIQLSVTKGAPPAQQQSRGSGQGNQQNYGLTGRDVFIRAAVSKSSLLKGESLQLTFKLYSNQNVTGYNIPKMPSLDGFWNQEIQLPQTLEKNYEVVDGQRYMVWEIKKLVLFPQQSGTLTIDPMEVQCFARVRVTTQRSNDPFGMFDQFFGGGYRDISLDLRSEPLKINVRELPSNAPDAFRGAVGRFEFSAQLDRKQTKANEAVNLKIRISGNGNMKLAEVPEPDFPEDLETYDPKVNENFKAGANGVSGSKTVEYLLIPRHEGEYEIPPITFSWFDPEKRQYQSRTAGPFTIDVAKGSGAAANISEGSSAKSEFRLLGNDIRYINVNARNLQPGTGRFYGSAFYYALSILPLLMFTGIVLWRRHKLKDEGNITLMRIRKAKSLAGMRLTQARKLLNGSDEKPVFDELQKALWGYLGDRFAIPAAELSREKVQEVMTSREVAPTLTETVLNCISDCEMARYGGVSSGIRPRDMYERAEKVIMDIEAALKA